MALDTTLAGAEADSYGTLAAFQSYAATVGWTLTASDATQEVYLRRAAMYLDRTYRWKGERKTREQALDWPRFVYDTDSDGFSISSDSIPTDIIHAQFELAWAAHEGTDLLAAITLAAVKSTRAKVGPLDEETEYFGAITRPVFPAVDGLLRDYVLGSGRVALVRG